jgi:hypothetical protein
MLKRLPLALILSFITLSAYLQETTLNDIHKRGFRGVKSIVDKTADEAVGHYAYFRRGDNMVLVILDTDLSVIKESSVSISEEAEIDESVYNGKDLMFLVRTKRSATIYTFTTKGDFIAQRSESFNEDQDISIYPSPVDNCFYIVAPTYYKMHTGYKVMKTDENFSMKWEKEFTPDKGYVVVEAAHADNNLFVVVQRTTPVLISLLAEKAIPELVAFDDRNGDILFKSPLFDGKSTGIPSQIIIDEDRNIVTAGMYFKGERMKGTNSKGIFIKKISETGEELIYNKLSWKKGVQKQMKRTKLRISGKNKVYFHDLVQGDDLGYQVVAESFSTSITIGNENSEWGKILNRKNFIAAIASGRYIGWAEEDVAPSIITAQDFLVFNFDVDGNLVDVRQIEKDYTKIFVYPPYTLTPGLRLANIINDFGFFDYAFTTKIGNSQQEVLISNAAYSKKPCIGITTITMGEEPTTKQIEFKELTGKRGSGKRGMAGCARGKPGKVLIYYFEKDDDKKKGKKNGVVHMYLENIEI